MPETDPYVWLGSRVLKNRLGLHSQGELSAVEYSYTLQRRLEWGGRPLRSDESIARGFGPMCWESRYD